MTSLAGVVAALEANACIEGEHDEPDFACCKARRALAALRSLPTNEALREEVARAMDAAAREEYERWRTQADVPDVEDLVAESERRITVARAAAAIDVIARALGVLPTKLLMSPGSENPSTKVSDAVDSDALGVGTEAPKP